MTSPTVVVKKIKQLCLEQTVNLVKESKLKFKQTVKLVKSCYRSEPVLTQKPDFVPPENSGLVKPSVKVDKPRPQWTHKHRDVSRQVKDVCQDVFCHVASLVPSVHTIGHPQKKGKKKSRSVVEKNKACQKCFFCISMSFCPKCSKCPQCCDRSSCRRPITGVLASLARVGCKSSGGFHFKGGLHPAVQNEASSYQVTYDSKRLRKSHKEPFPPRHCQV